MDKRFLIPDITQALETKAFPTITMWNRQEGRPRTDNFTRALQAEVRDALWMLTRQWQLGEFQGDDAGTPVKVKVQISTSPFEQFKAAGGSVEAMAGDVPLETLAERRRIAMAIAGRPMHLDLRLQLGRRWAQLLRAANLDAYIPRYRDAYRFELPDPDDTAAERVYAHMESWQQYAAVAGRAIDGYALYDHLAKGSPNAASDGIALLQPGDKQPLDGLGTELAAWFEQFYTQPAAARDAWLPARLEYQFSCAAAGEELTAADYYQDTPDWYVFDRGKSAASAGGTRSVVTLLPTAVEFDGMPDTRWWAFEDRKTNFGNVTPNTTDLAKLLLMEFALVYANDWFIVPFRLPIGSTARVDALVVTNTFGEHHWIDASGSRPGDKWQRWDMFGLAGARTDRPRLVLPALTAKTQSGDPIEVVNCIRDEMANMVWGVECTIPLVNGYGRAGRESAVETRQVLRETGGRVRGRRARASLPCKGQLRRDDARAGTLDSVHAGPRRGRQPGDSAAAFEDAPADRRRSPGAGSHCPSHGTAARGARRVAEASVLPPRGRGPAGRHPGRTELPADAMGRRPGLRVARRGEADRPRRGLERARLRSAIRRSAEMRPARPGSACAACNTGTIPHSVSRRSARSAR